VLTLIAHLAVNGFPRFETIFASGPAAVNFDARFLPVSGLLLAIRYLTVLPLGALDRAQAGGLGRATPWFPVVGLLLGALVAAVDTLAVQLFSAPVSAILTVAAWKTVTGGLHLDGLADTLDGLMGGDRERRLAIMRDSRIGTFGALGLIFVLGLEIAAVAELPPTFRWRLLLVAPAVGRAVPPVLARLFGAARPEGQGAAFVATVGGAGSVIALSVAAALATILLGASGAVSATLAVAVALGGAWLVARRLGGVTGDVLGAAVETTELVVILAVLAWASARA
jgi:adenosylcobinamide-GDP ribazoletransferase